MSDGSRIAAWRESITYEIEAMMCEDRSIALAFAEALAIRLSFKYDPPAPLEREQIQTLPNVPGVGHC